MYLRRIELLYVMNATVLLTHEIDSGYWREWELLHLPGGPQGFLLLHLVLLPLVLMGLVQLARGRRSGLWFALGLAASGVLAVLIHGSFLLGGDPAFRMPVSLAILAGGGLLSVWLGGVAWVELNPGPSGGRRGGGPGERTG